jgi:hypothetical protein
VVQPPADGASVWDLDAGNSPAFVLSGAPRFGGACRYDLYRLSPADSVAVQQSLRGWNQPGSLAVIMSTFLTLLLLVLLTGGSPVVTPVVLSLLLVEYVCTAVGTLIFRLLMGRIIQTRKEEEMELPQVRLNDLLPRLEELTEEEYEKMQRLQETQDAIRHLPENLLPLGAIARTVGALLLSTLTVLATAFAQEWLAGLLKRFVP